MLVLLMLAQVALKVQDKPHCRLQRSYKCFLIRSFASVVIAHDLHKNLGQFQQRCQEALLGCGMRVAVCQAGRV